MSMDEFIPPGFVPLANWDSRNRRHNDGHSVEWKTLSDAVRNSEIPGFKLGNGRWYVHERVSNEYLAKLSAKASATEKQDSCSAISPSAEASAIALCEINNTLSMAYGLLERLTAAVESIATQPQHEAVGTWRDMNGEAH